MRLGSSLPIVCCLLGAFAGAQDVSPERVKSLEDALRSERDRNDQQSKRIEELELTLASVVSAQTEQVRQEAVTAEIDRVASKLLDERLASLRKKDESRSPVTVTGQTRFTLRLFSGIPITTDQSFELEHLIVEFTMRLGDHFRMRFSPGISHQGAVYALETYGAYTISPALEIWAGRFLIPFNGIHSWAFPSDSFIEPYLPENAPKPFLYAPYWDEGLLVTGRVPFGCSKEHELWYAGYVINGFDTFGMDGIHKRNIGDNNDNKTVGGRASVTFRLGEETTLAFGVGGLTGKYDAFDKLSFYAAEADVEFVTGPLSIYLEAFHRPSEISGTVIENPAALLTEVARLSGMKFRPQVKIAPNLALFAQLDQLVVQQPPRFGGQFSVLELDDETFSIRTGTLGIKYDIAPHLRLILEGGIFDRDSDIGPDIRYIAFSTFYYF